VITPEQYRTACSAWSQTGARVSALLSGKYRDTGRFYQLCGELAHKKHQYANFGNEGGNQAIIERIRKELAHLSTKVTS